MLSVFVVVKVNNSVFDSFQFEIKFTYFKFIFEFTYYFAVIQEIEMSSSESEDNINLKVCIV